MAVHRNQVKKLNIYVIAMIGIDKWRDIWSDQGFSRFPDVVRPLYVWCWWAAWAAQLWAHLEEWGARRNAQPHHTQLGLQWQTVLLSGACKSKLNVQKAQSFTFYACNRCEVSAKNGFDEICQKVKDFPVNRFEHRNRCGHGSKRVVTDADSDVMLSYMYTSHMELRRTQTSDYDIIQLSIFRMLHEENL